MTDWRLNCCGLYILKRIGISCDVHIALTYQALVVLKQPHRGSSDVTQVISALQVSSFHEASNVYKAEVGRQVHCGQRKSESLQRHLKLRLSQYNTATRNAPAQADLAAGTRCHSSTRVP